jgi:hypothetical protein
LARKKESDGAPTPKAAALWPADKVERQSVASHVPYARNLRTHGGEQVDERGGLVAGHGRVLAAKKLGLREFPVMVVSGWSQEQKRAYVIADNKLTFNGGWDEELLTAELGELAELDVDLGLASSSPRSARCPGRQRPRAGSNCRARASTRSNIVRHARLRQGMAVLFIAGTASWTASSPSTVPTK